MTKPTRIFLTGATGFLGGTLAVRLAAKGHEVHGLTRSENSTTGLRSAGIIPVLGTLDDVDVLIDEARAADVVINAADSDHAASVDTLLTAMEGSAKPFLHTSGSSIVGEPSNGEPSDDIYTETDVLPGGSWTPAPDKQARVAIDRKIIAAKDRGVRSVVLCNTMIYGTGEGLHRDSVQIPRLVTTARRTGVVRLVGRGANRWSNVSLSDACDLYELALEAAPPGSFYFVENGEASFADIGQAIADALRLGPPQPLPVAQAVTEWGYEPAVFALGSNSRVRGRAARELGWTPRDPSVTDWIRSAISP